MRSLRPLPTVYGDVDVDADVDAIAFLIAGRSARLAAPRRLLSIVDTMMAKVPRAERTVHPDMTVAVVATDDVWEIRGFEGSTILNVRSPLPQVAGAAITAIVNGIAAIRQTVLVRATVVEKDGRALAIIGDDWESAITLGAHLHCRGWHFVASDNVLFDPRNGTVHGVEKSLFINAASVPHLPVRYRRAVEASPWFVVGEGIAFYAVDPTATGIAGTWSAAAALAAIAVVDGATGSSPALETVGPQRSEEARFVRMQLDPGAMRVVDVRLGGVVETCDLLEHWFDAH